jgi:signal transduction histidine kinase
MVLLVGTLVFYYRTKHLNKLLQNANTNLAESNDQKDKFFSIVAHDIRSPLVSTVSIMKLIASGDLDHDTQLEVVNKLALHNESSLEILDKLLKWGQMQIKGVKMNVTQFNASKSVHNNFKLLKAVAEKKEIKVAINIHEKIELNGDADHFEFVVRNMLANAIKFTKEGGKVWIAAIAMANGLVKFTVKDTGVGISEVRLNKLFQLSATGTKGTSNEEGTSLGLVICKQFITANHGEIKVTSEVNVGTTFEFTFPSAKNVA